jgi:hypothetical protein
MLIACESGSTSIIPQDSKKEQMSAAIRMAQESRNIFMMLLLEPIGILITIDLIECGPFSIITLTTGVHHV